MDKERIRYMIQETSKELTGRSARISFTGNEIINVTLISDDFAGKSFRDRHSHAWKYFDETRGDLLSRYIILFETFTSDEYKSKVS